MPKDDLILNDIHFESMQQRLERLQNPFMHVPVPTRDVVARTVARIDGKKPRPAGPQRQPRDPNTPPRREGNPACLVVSDERNGPTERRQPNSDPRKVPRDG